MAYEPTKLMLDTSFYDVRRADFAVNFISSLPHTKGQWAQQPFLLMPWQETIIRDLFGIVDKETGKRQFKTAYIEIGKKNGKQVALNTPIPTPNGFTTMGEIQVGDIVFSETGEKCNVVAKSKVDFSEQGYRITFKDGEVIDAGANHQWYGEWTSSNKRKSGVVNTEWLYKRSTRQPYVKKQSLDFRIPDYVTSMDFRYIHSIVPIENTGMQCIQVDSPSHCYLIGKSYLMTHNSELAAAIALYLLMADGEIGAEVYSCAADTNQAKIVYDVACDMVKIASELNKDWKSNSNQEIKKMWIDNNVKPLNLINYLKLVPSTKRIMFHHARSFYRVLSSETKNKQGFNVSGLIFDELFAQQTRELFDTMTKFTGDARSQPLHFLITTAGRDKNSICYEMHCKAKAILDGVKTDPAFYPVVYGMDEGDDWTSPEVWYKCNPSIGVTLDIKDITAACEQAKQSAGDELWFRQFRLNEWTNADIRWMSMDKWNKCGEIIDWEEFEGRECYGGLDLSCTSDLTSLVLVFTPFGGDDKYTIMPFFWLPKDVIEFRTKRDHVPYRVWEKQGVFNTTEGDRVDYDTIVGFISKLKDKFQIQEIAYDRYGAEKVRRDLAEIGEESGFNVVPFGQGFLSMSPPSKDLEQFVSDGKIRHGKHPVLDWNMSNVIVKMDEAGNIKPDKNKSTEKIDGAVATIMALARAVAHNNNPQIAYADGRSMLFI